MRHKSFTDKLTVAKNIFHPCIVFGTIDGVKKKGCLKNQRPPSLLYMPDN
jgi:hypothetical protein